MNSRNKITELKNALNASSQLKRFLFIWKLKILKTLNNNNLLCYVEITILTPIVKLGYNINSTANGSRTASEIRLGYNINSTANGSRTASEIRLGYNINSTANGSRTASEIRLGEVQSN